MKMKRSRKLLALIVLTAVTLMAAFTGCGSAGNNPSATTAANTDGATGAGTTAEGFGEPVTLQWLSTTSDFSGPWTGWLDDFVLEKTGVHIEMVQCTAERMQASLAAGELADLVTFNGWVTVDSAIKGKMLINLDEHMDALPNVVANTGKALQYVRDERSGETGKAYVIPDYIGEYRTPLDTGVYAANVRWDIYQAIGAPEVKTMDDFLPVLKQMQDYYPKTPDGQKVYAFSVFPDWDWHNMYAAFSLFTLQGHFEGLSGSYLDWNTKDNVITPLLDQDGLYVHALKFYNQAYRMGIFDPDSMTQTQPTGYAKLQAGAVLTAWNCWDGEGAFNTNENINADSPKGFKPVIFDDFYAATMGDYPIGTTSPLGIGSNCKNVDAALRFVDFLANYDYLTTLYNGPQGFLWDVGSDGKPYVTDKYFEYLGNRDMEVPGGGKVEQNGLRKMIIETRVNPEYGVPFAMAYWDKPIEIRTDNNLAKSWADFYGYATPIKLIEDQNRLIKRPLSHNFMETEPDDIATMSNQIGDIVKTSSWKMVYAKNDDEFNALYKDMMTKAEGLGLQKVMDWAKEAHERAEVKAAKYEN